MKKHAIISAVGFLLILTACTGAADANSTAENSAATTQTAFGDPVKICAAVNKEKRLRRAVSLFPLSVREAVLQPSDIFLNAYFPPHPPKNFFTPRLDYPGKM